ncbi:unnamed protein product [Dicrocoelium dendriticum]|nr:unnamed protein product [Dicrocoelium dendriticum]
MRETIRDKVEEVRKSSSSSRKAKVHDQQVIAMLYCIVLLAIGLSVTLYCTGCPVAELEFSFIVSSSHNTVCTDFSKQFV